MTAIEPTGQILGATVRGVDLSKSLGGADFAAILLAPVGPHRHAPTNAIADYLLDEHRLMKRC